ncbi:unnamed protein product, partial [Mesorhabditis belari]|uniref:Protein kinase domain-containing protein n=1 Tax=Mesorhabditis belari TaxID=2138241 RepID=A0AAF3J4A2_9BILA
MTLKQYYEAVNGKGIDVEKLRIILAQILEALSYLHKKGIMHRAIRPENIGVQENNGRLVLKLFNFGLSREITGDEIEVANKVRRRGGECAVLDRIFEVLGVQPDLSKLNREGSLSADLKRKITLVNGNEEEVNSLCDLITQMLLVDPKKRLSADVCLKHKFLRPSMGEPMEIDAEADLPTTVSLENCTLLKDLKAGRTRLSFDIDLLDAEIKRKY